MSATAVGRSFTKVVVGMGYKYAGDVSHCRRQMDVPPGKASRVPFRRRRYGVYDLAYEVPESPSTLRIYSLLDRLRAVHAKFPAVRRLVVDTINLAPVAFVAYMAGTVWQGVYRAINLYCLTVFFDRVCRCRHLDGWCFLHSQQLGDGALSSEACRCLAASWLCCAVINVQIDRMQCVLWQGCA